MGTKAEDDVKKSGSGVKLGMLFATTTISLVIVLIGFIIGYYLVPFSDENHSRASIRSDCPNDNNPANPYFYFRNKEGLCIYVDLFFENTIESVDKSPRGLLFWSHGAGDHPRRQIQYHDALNKIGIRVIALHHAGQGKSDGDVFHSTNYTRWVDDFLHVIDLYFERNPDSIDSPVFIGGHSLGGATAFEALSRLAKDKDLLKTSLNFHGAIFTAPALQLDPAIATPFTRTLSHFLSTYLPKMPLFGNEIDPAGLSRIDSVLEEHKSDPLVPKNPLTARFGSTFLEYLFALSDADYQSFEWPFIVLHGTHDKITAPEGSKRLYQLARSKDKTMKLYEGHYHELQHDEGSEKVIADLIEWVSNHLPTNQDSQ